MCQALHSVLEIPHRSFSTLHTLPCSSQPQIQIVISLSNQYIHCFTKDQFYFSGCQLVSSTWMSHRHLKFKMLKSKTIMPSIASLQVDSVLTESSFFPFPVLQVHILNVPQLCTLNYSPTTMCTFKTCPGWNTNSSTSIGALLPSPVSHLSILPNLTLSFPVLLSAIPNPPQDQAQRVSMAYRLSKVPAHLLLLQIPHSVVHRISSLLISELNSILLPFKAEFCWPLFQIDLPDHNHHTHTHDKMWVLLHIPRMFCLLLHSLYYHFLLMCF